MTAGNIQSQHCALLGWGLVILLTPGWSQAEVNTAWLEKTRKVEAPPEMIERIKQTGWLDLFHTCNSMAMKGGDYLDCIRVEAALLPPLDPSKRAHFGQHYDPYKYFTCRSETDNRNTSCNKFKLRRNEAEPVWPYPDAPPIVWPDAPDPPVYQPWMSSKAYFDALCESEAGKFIYRTVEDVEGVYQVRPMIKASDLTLMDRYVMENPYHYSLGEAASLGASQVGPDKYRFRETSLYEPKERWDAWRLEFRHPSVFEKAKPGDKYIQYSEYDGHDLKSVIKTFKQSLESEFGYVWRGITRPNDRVHGIAGGELLVIDLKTNEILGLWRGFVRSGTKSSERVWWLAPHSCPQRTGDSEELARFILEILRPKR